MQISIEDKVHELESSLTKNNNARFTVFFEADGRIVEAEFFKDIQLNFWQVKLFDGTAAHSIYISQLWKTAKLYEALKELNQWLPAGLLIADTLSLSICGAKPDPQNELSRSTKAVLRDYFKNSTNELPENVKADPELARQLVFRDNLGKALSRDTIDIASWNKRSTIEKQQGKWQASRLNDMDLDGIDLSHLQFQGSKFDNSRMTRANLTATNFQDSSFRNTKLEKANLEYAKLKGCDFTGANLKGAKLSHTSLANVNLTNADLSGAVARETDLCGVDLTVCTTRGITLDKSKYDQHTKLPADFREIGVMHWAGSGANPYEDICRDVIENICLSTFEELIPHLRIHFDKAKINKVLSMLKKESFQLFTEVDKDQVCGVLKSQTDKDLVYSCVLNTDGTFWCCTQNLRICGGLKGSVCKHILVMVIGLAKVGQLDASNGTKWILRSKLVEKKPQIDKEKATSIFLKHKGAEANEIDWRPTETVPEDFYAF